jgi:hypothetical protein
MMLILFADMAAGQVPLELAGCKAERNLVWHADESTLEFHAPVLTVHGKRSANEPVSCLVKLISCELEKGQGKLDYELAIDDRGVRYRGKYGARVELHEGGGHSVLTRRSDLRFDPPLCLDLSISESVTVAGKPINACVLPLRNGVVQTLPLAAGPTLAGHYILGRGSQTEGKELAMPVIGLSRSPGAAGGLALATDPYVGSQFTVTPGKAPAGKLTVKLSTTYLGSMVPLDREQRTAVCALHHGGVDGTLRTYYETIPDIEPGAPWIHDIQLTHFDYIAKQGKGIYRDVEKLAERIPVEHRKAVVVALHGYYDYLGRYGYNAKTHRLDPQWVSYDGHARKVPMNPGEIHKRIKFVKDHGFRVLLYFADGMTYHDASPDFRKDWCLKDEHGKAVYCGNWEHRPDAPGPKNFCLDPTLPGVQDWFMGYEDALLNEFGREFDGLVWDETFLATRRRAMSGTGGRLAYLDRAMMRLVAALTRRVQTWHKVNPDLVFLTSDDLDMVGLGKDTAPYALVSHGTYQDSWCKPDAWPPGLLPNYRNCLWSCNWHPVKNRTWNAIAVERYGIAQGITDGFGDDQGPADMPPALFDEIIARFLKRFESGDRTRYLRQ